MDGVNVVLTLGVAQELVERIRAVDPRLTVRLLSRRQRQVYRAGRSIWVGYSEPVEAGTEDEAEARHVWRRSWPRQRCS